MPRRSAMLNISPRRLLNDSSVQRMAISPFPSSHRAYIVPLQRIGRQTNRLEQVLSNKVGDALKFSPVGATTTVRVAEST
jgi:signal transduction histidine kinase